MQTVNTQDIYLGQNGSNIIQSSAGTITGSWFSFLCLTDVTFTTLSGSVVPTVHGSLTLSQLLFPRGTQIFGNFNTMNVSSGTLIAYKG